MAMANERERAYWNAGTGERWVRHQAALDRSFGEISDLLFARAAPAPGERALDIGCGSGETTLEVARRVGPQGIVTGVDLSDLLLAVARRRAAGLANLRFVAADAETHPFEAGGTDLALSRFGVMFFNGPVAAFRNIRRALRPGGRLAFVCWGPLEANPWFRTPLEIGIRHLGPPEPLPPRAPGPLAFGEPDYVAEILAAAGFGDPDIREAHPTLLGLATAEEEAGLAMALGPTSRLIAARKPDAGALAVLAKDIADALRPNQTGGGMRMPSTVFVVSARAP